MRQFIKGTDGFSGAFAECLCGSPNLYQVSLVSLCSVLISVNLLLDSINLVYRYESFLFFICSITFLLLYSLNEKFAVS